MPEPVCQTFALELPVAAPGRPLDICLAPGAVLLVDGAPEAGRSTLLKVLAGLLRPKAGDLALFGQSLRHLSKAGLTRIRNRLGVVFENDGLIPSWSAQENLLLPLKYRRPGAEPAHLARIRERLSLIHEHPDILAKRVSTLTARQRRRLALLRTLLLEPELMLLDDLPNYLGDDSQARTDLMSELDTGRCTIIAAAPTAWREHFRHGPVTTLELGAGIPAVDKGH